MILRFGAGPPFVEALAGLGFVKATRSPHVARRLHGYTEIQGEARAIRYRVGAYPSLAPSTES